MFNDRNSFVQNMSEQTEQLVNLVVFTTAKEVSGKKTKGFMSKKFEKLEEKVYPPKRRFFGLLGPKKK